MEDQIREAYAQGRTELKAEILNLIQDVIREHDSNIREYGEDQYGLDCRIDDLIETVKAIQL